MTPPHESVVLAELQQNLIENLLDITRRMESALSASDIDRFSQELAVRQGLFVRLQENQTRLEGFQQTASRDGRELPPVVTELIVANRRRLQDVLEIDRRCMEIGEVRKRDIARRLGETRAAKKLKKEYRPSDPRAGKRSLLNGKA